MIAKAILMHGRHALRQLTALRASQPRDSRRAAERWQGIDDLDARLRRDIGLSGEAADWRTPATTWPGLIGSVPLVATGAPPELPLGSQQDSITSGVTKVTEPGLQASDDGAIEVGPGEGKMKLTKHAAKYSVCALAVVLGLSTLSAAPPRERSEADIVRSVLPSVVNLTVWKSADDAATPDEAKMPAQYYGSGFVVDRSGLILTNRHVIEGAQDITVTFADGTHARATLCAASRLVDLAVVKVNGRPDLSPATWGSSGAVRMGDRVLAIGNPLGVGVSVSAGIVSALHRHVSSNPFDDFVQTDAAINHGNSGGMLVNGAGEVVGVNTAFLSDRANGGSLGVGFAIPSSEAASAVHHLKDCNPQAPGWIGVTLQQVTAEIASEIGLPKPVGSIVTGVAPDSPAKQAGLQEGDVLESLSDAAEPTPVQMLERIALTKVGTEVRIGYRRQGHASEATVTLAPWPSQKASQTDGAQSAAMRAISPHVLGIRLADRPGSSGASRTVVLSIDPAIGMGDSELQPGDVVLQVGHRPALSVDTVRSVLREEIQAGRHSPLLLVERGDARRWVVMPLRTRNVAVL